MSKTQVDNTGLYILYITAQDNLLHYGEQKDILTFCRC
jgi:hypothetical protein